jgi:NADPH2:quinone reductase
MTSALVVTEHGDSSVLQLQQQDLPDLGAGDLLVDVAASGVNFIEVYQRQGVYPRPTPFVLGVEGAGAVSGVGSAVVGFAVGDKVAWASAPGSHADQVIVSAGAAVPVPDEVDLEDAGAAMLQGMTAHYLVSSTYPVQPGDSVLIHAAAGGVGQLLIQLAKAKGARVIGTVSTEAKAAQALSVGADEVVRYKDSSSEQLAEAIRAANGGAGVSVVYDGVGRSTFEASLAALAPRGMLVLFGASSGQVPPFDLQRLNPAGSLFVTRPTLTDYIATREELLWRGGDILGAVAAGALKIAIGGRYPLASAARAYDDLEGRQTMGKLILTR